MPFWRRGGKTEGPAHPAAPAPRNHRLFIWLVEASAHPEDGEAEGQERDGGAQDVSIHWKSRSGSRAGRRDSCRVHRGLGASQGGLGAGVAADTVGAVPLGIQKAVPSRQSSRPGGICGRSETERRIVALCERPGETTWLIVGAQIELDDDADRDDQREGEEYCQDGPARQGAHRNAHGEGHQRGGDEHRPGELKAPWFGLLVNSSRG